MQKKGAGEQARADGKMMIAMEHYPVLPGQPVLFLIGDARQAEARKLIDQLFLQQKKLLSTFLEHKAISKEDYEKSLHYLTIKMGGE